MGTKSPSQARLNRGMQQVVDRAFELAPGCGGHRMRDDPIGRGCCMSEALDLRHGDLGVVAVKRIALCRGVRCGCLESGYESEAKPVSSPDGSGRLDRAATLNAAKAHKDLLVVGPQTSPLLRIYGVDNLHWFNDRHDERWCSRVCTLLSCEGTSLALLFPSHHAMAHRISTATSPASCPQELIPFPPVARRIPVQSLAASGRLCGLYSPFRGPPAIDFLILAGGHRAFERSNSALQPYATCARCQRQLSVYCCMQSHRRVIFSYLLNCQN
jgi:hypothetical protein